MIKSKKVKCTECGAMVKIKDMITDKLMLKKYGEGCTYFGHIVNKNRLKELK